MQEPNFKLVFKESVSVPKHEGVGNTIVKVLLLSFVLIGAIMSLMLGENIFKELSLQIWVCILIGVGYWIKNSGYVRVPSECELWFYDDRLVQFRSKRYYTKKTIRQEYRSFLYKDIKKCLYRRTTEQIHISGIVEGTYYNYDKNGMLGVEPSYHKVVDAGTYFYITLEPNIDFVNIIETYSPLKVEIHDT